MGRRRAGRQGARHRPARLTVPTAIGRALRLGALTQALDAGFPFLTGFPLLPHLSHDDGRKLDLAFYYRTLERGYRRGATRSPIGYWAFERPRPGEWDACPEPTARFGLRWEMRWFEVFDANVSLDAARTRTALAWLRDQGPAHGVQRVFVEPHLAGRLGVTGGVIRFQGCRAARHDDHIHFQTVRQTPPCHTSSRRADPIRLTILGCGDAFGTGGRLQACFLLETAAATLLADCGATALSAIKGRGVDPNAIDAILISHLHGDHFGGLPFFLLDAQFQSRRRRPLAIYRPPSTADRLESAMECFFPGSTNNRWRFDWHVAELPEGPNDLDFGRVTAAAGRHPSGAPPYAYRIEADGRTFAYTGDTEWVDALAPILRGADLALTECYFPEAKAPFHLDQATLAAHAAELGLTRILATHMGPAMLAALPLAPPFIAAEEGAVFEI